MKLRILIALILFSSAVIGQTFNPTLSIPVAKPLAVTGSGPIDARSMKYDPVNFTYRPYRDTAEVNAYLNLSKYRTGKFTVYIQVGGTLNSNGTFTGGELKEFWYRDGTRNIDLVKKASFYFDSVGNVTLDGDIKVAAKNYQISPTGIIALGHSIMAGQNATVSDSTFINRTGRYFNLPVDNYALGGSGAWRAAKNFHDNVSFKNSKTTFVMAQLNDIRRSHTDATYRKIVNCYKSIFANHFLASFVEAGVTTSEIVKYGSWTDGYHSDQVGGKGTNGTYTTAVNDSIVHTFIDSTITIHMEGGDGTSGDYDYTSSFEIWIDGVLKETPSANNQTDGVSDGIYDNKRVPMAFWFTGLGPGTHKVKLVNKDVGYMVVTAFGHFLPSLATVPLVVMHDPHLSSTGYALSPNQATDFYIDKGNTKVDSLVGTFPTWLRTIIVPTETYYNVTTGIDGDNIHFSNVGHRQEYTGIITTIPSFPSGGVDGTIGYSAYTGDLTFIEHNKVKSVAAKEETVGISRGLPKSVLFLGTEYLINKASASAYYTFDSPRVQLTVGGVRIGNGNAFDQRITSVDIFEDVNGYPHLTRYYKTGSANNHESDWYTDGAYIYERFIDDASNPSTWMRSKRSDLSVDFYGTVSGAPATASTHLVPLSQLNDSLANRQRTDTVITITSGTSYTVPTTTYKKVKIYLDLASVAATYAFTLPTPYTSGNVEQVIEIHFGGTITSGNPVVTAITVNGTVVQSTTLNGSQIVAGDKLIYTTHNSKFYR